VETQDAEIVRFLISTLGLGLVFLFGALEEISWGQRIFGIETPAYFVENNLQRETNLHNLEILGVRINRLVFSQGLGVITLLYLIALPVTTSRSPRVRTWIDCLGIPIPRVSDIVTIVIVFLVAFAAPISSRFELSEFGICTLLFQVVLHPRNAKVFEARTQGGA